MFLDVFDEESLKKYLGDIILAWLSYRSLPGDFRKLLTIPFYANITRRLYLNPDRPDRKPGNRGDLLIGFEAELFREAGKRDIEIFAPGKSQGSGDALPLR